MPVLYWTSQKGPAFCASQGMTTSRRFWRGREGSSGGKAPLTSCTVSWAMRWAFRIRGCEGCKEDSECSHMSSRIKGWAKWEESRNWHTSHVTCRAIGPTYQQSCSTSAVASLGQQRAIAGRKESTGVLQEGSLARPLRTLVWRLQLSNTTLRSSIFQMW